jgi:hypothetical protein
MAYHVPHPGGEGNAVDPPILVGRRPSVAERVSSPAPPGKPRAMTNIGGPVTAAERATGRSARARALLAYAEAKRRVTGRTSSFASSPVTLISPQRLDRAGRFPRAPFAVAVGGDRRRDAYQSARGSARQRRQHHRRPVAGHHHPPALAAPRSHQPSPARHAPGDGRRAARECWTAPATDAVVTGMERGGAAVAARELELALGDSADALDGLGYRTSHRVRARGEPAHERLRGWRRVSRRLTVNHRCRPPIAVGDLRRFRLRRPVAGRFRAGSPPVEPEPSS